MENFKELLHNKKMKATPVRLDLLRVFTENKHALSHSELEKLMKETGDRVTVYRSINAFEEKGIIHKAIEEEGVARYALCHASCTEEHHKDDHIHFNCEKCRKTYCWYDSKMPGISIPEGYKVTQQKIVLQGVCPNCK